MKEHLLEFIRLQGPIKRTNLLLGLRTIGYTDLKDRRMRLLIVDLIRDGHPIASSEKGYSLIQTKEQLNEAVNYLESKAKALSIRGNTLIGNFNLKYHSMEDSTQFRLEL